MKSLNRLDEIHELIKQKQEKIDRLREALESITAALKDCPVQSGGTKNKLEDYMSMIVDLEKEIETLTAEAAEIKIVLLDQCLALDVNQYNVILLRYFQHKTFTEMSYEMGYSRSWVYRIFNEAMEILEKNDT